MTSGVDSILVIETHPRFRPAHGFVALGLFGCLVLAGCAANGPATPRISWATPAAIQYGTALSATQLNATAAVAGTFTYSPALGTVLQAGAQRLSVTFTPSEPIDYTTATASVTLTVSQVSPGLSWATPAAITYASPLGATQLDATASVPGAFIYTPAPGAVLTAGSQTLSVKFIPTDATDYATATAAVTLAVNQAAPILQWAAPAAISYGTALSATQMNATASVPGTFSYSPSSGTLPGIGANTLSVTFAPFDSTDYTSASASVTLSVIQATPQIVWTPSFPIAVGAPIGPYQLDATALAPNSTSVLAGNFLYSPAAGTVFSSSGPQTLSATFTPANTIDYTTAASSISMNVSSFGVAAWGDSLTAGTSDPIDEEAYPTELGGLIVLPVVNEGIKGNTSTQIGVRQGGVPTYATVSGGVIPASGGVTVTFPKGYEPITGAGPAGGISGTILGVHGLVTIDPTGTIFTFTRTTAGSAFGATGSPRFVVDTPYAASLPVFWEGRNNYDNGPQIISDLAAQVATVPSGQNYLVMSVTNDNRQWEWIGAGGYQLIIAVNTQLASIYGSHYLDIRKVLVDSYNPALITDVSDYAHDEVPTSLRGIVYDSLTLGNAVGPSDTIITINPNADGWGTAGILTIDTGKNAENVVITAVSGNTVTVQRNFGGNNTSHAAGVPMVLTDSVHLNAQGYQVVANAVAQYLAAYEIP
jgi:lysophospholipase L1-like esterase